MLTYNSGWYIKHTSAVSEPAADSDAPGQVNLIIQKPPLWNAAISGSKYYEATLETTFNWNQNDSDIPNSGNVAAGDSCERWQMWPSVILVNVFLMINIISFF